MQSKMKNLETKVKGVSLVTMLVCVCGIIPILWIAKYNVIGLDDYSFGVMSHQAWKETKSVWKFIEAAFIATKDNYLNWQGSFTYNFLSHIYLAYIDEKFAWVTPVLMLSTIIFSLHYLYFCLIERLMIKKTKYAYINAASDKDKYVAVSALESLCSGEARTYYEEALERYELLNDETISEVKLHPYSVKPHVLFCGDIVEEGNEDFWINNAVQRYYMKEKVVLNVE